jgi:hypothetical protein
MPMDFVDSPQDGTVSDETAPQSVPQSMTLHASDMHPNLQRAMREAAMTSLPGDRPADPPTASERAMLRTAAETVDDIMDEAVTGRLSRWRRQF